VALDWADFLKDYLEDGLWQKLHALVAAVPEDYHMLHGDYHIKNVMLQNGESLLIDMDTLCHGHPVFELASMFNAYRGFSELDPEEAAKFQGSSREDAARLWELSLRLYLGTEDEAKLKAVEDEAMLIGFARLMRRAIRRKALETEKGRRQVDVCRAHIEELLSRVDSLVF
jgi:aminoglycoside phosphotransferase (APT) family kinase protein